MTMRLPSTILRSPRLGRTLLLAAVVCACARSAHAASPAQKPQATGAMCTDGRFVAAPSAERAAEPLRDEDLPWCVNAGDPRCAPLHKDAAHHAFGLRTVVAADAFAVALPAPRAGVEQSRTPRASLCPRAGVSSRVERPPRPSRPLS
ncbi:MAG: hypothetical protein ACHQ53_09405 [Polyangiales bacterium]